ncbi:hypothetical protein HanPSC8_Chr03g0090891 [Helianthus annuus]|nr:hypothetical protein HanPSC8_Chr03g0090891 [Helianthus annuus]
MVVYSKSNSLYCTFISAFHFSNPIRLPSDADSQRKTQLTATHLSHSKIHNFFSLKTHHPPIHPEIDTYV